MIVIGAYPSQLQGSAGPLGIAALGAVLDEWFGPAPALHLLPFFPSSGDFGFAPNDILAVSPAYGSWRDVQKIATQRRLIIDGVFNHVGREHDWMHAFVADPKAFSDTIIAYKRVTPSDGPNSPRGDFALRPIQTSDGTWHIWQTFTECAVDVHLGSDRVRAYIGEFLKRAADAGVWGIRLDAVAYYAKRLGGSIRHNDGVHELAEAVAQQVWANNLFAMAQLDSDADGLRYFAHDKYRSIPVNDFSFAAHLLLALCEQRASQVADYVNVTAHIDRCFIRAPRTHDGILLRSGNFNTADKSALIENAVRLGLNVRYANGDAYELNCSGPHFLRLVAGPDHFLAAIEVIAAITILVSDFSYFYFPFLIGYAPEDSVQSNASDSDPRALNRNAVPLAFFSSDSIAAHVRRLRQLFTQFIQFRSSGSTRAHVKAEAAGAILQLRCQQSGITLFANIGLASIEYQVKGQQIVFGNRCSSSSLGPYGYAVLR